LTVKRIIANVIMAACALVAGICMAPVIALGAALWWAVDQMDVGNE
jgi:hypothetical protein